MIQGTFYEMEYNANPASEVGNIVLKPQKIAVPAKDEVREIFVKMRNIARAHRSTLSMYHSADYYSNFFHQNIQRDNAAIFYKQGLFMQDYTDDYKGNTPLSQYFPNYQTMGYEQLRTYFTWRTRVRQGDVCATSLSYAFLYIYELLGNIGVVNPQEGLDKLMSFWKSYSVHSKSIDRYMLQWLKDYHIYYDMAPLFKEFIERNELTGHYCRVNDTIAHSSLRTERSGDPQSHDSKRCSAIAGQARNDGKADLTWRSPKITETAANFDLFCAVSKYDMRKSAFYTDETKNRIVDCFTFVLDRLRHDFETVGMQFDDTFFRPTRKLVAWVPFQDAVFHPRLNQTDRRVVLSENEIYVCKNNEWSFSTVITSEKGKLFIGYVMKQMEAELRKMMNYRFKLATNKNMVHPETIRVLEKKGLFIEKIVPDAVVKFHREATKTVVTVDHTSLARIRHEALITQEALIVEEQKDSAATGQKPFSDATLSDAPTSVQNPFGDDGATNFSSVQNPYHDISDTDPIPVSDRWERLRDDLSENELQALAVLLQGEDIKIYAANRGIMPEVLMDGINIKAMDYIGDNLMDEAFVLYDDYINQIEDLFFHNKRCTFEPEKNVETAKPNRSTICELTY